MKLSTDVEIKQTKSDLSSIIHNTIMRNGLTKHSYKSNRAISV